LNHVAPQQIVLGQGEAAPDWQASGIERGLPRSEIASVLAETVPNVADRAHTKADQIAAAMRRVSHEIAVQPARILWAREVVVWKGEMIHADVTVACGLELLDCKPQQRNSQLRAGKSRAVDLALRLEELRHVGVAVHCQPIG